MYLPRHFEETDAGVLHALIRAHPLGTWVTAGEGGLIANHIPFLLHPDRGPRGTLVGHVARANVAWRSFSRTVPSVVIFQGPEAYITPSWYPSKQEHGKVVPTWNYAVVHAHGIPTAIEDHDWLLAHVTELTRVHESAEEKPWAVGDAPREFIDKMLAAIVGIEIPIEVLEGKWKVNQNREPQDQRGAAAGLERRGTPESTEMAGLVRARAKPLP
jgi:transcriptional regulator